ncbi:MAG: 50S ribosomal protein L9 [Gammaproteobacteria bacterium]|jgi:large subunit ribosomal protein L9|nr:50S ribosomal protein L9 [Gammaproteobacteria bacterium]MBK80565.1 50S ribosomal protein L9 [Gammaproteobacteria bacterium]|tara:strand:+ start:3160 stop:3606 length:447 start_codon:yes stop_codon:yes gene_type:complete
MNVILLERIGNLGDLGDEVVVKPGFARNFLIPQGKAVRATDANRAEFEQRRAELEAQAAEVMAEASKRGEQLEGMAITIVVKAGDEGKLYGSVGTQDIADAVTAKGVEIEKSEVKLPEGTIRELGEYEIDIQLHSDVMITIQLSVVPE